jgi:hypothetical protein
LDVDDHVHHGRLGRLGLRLGFVSGAAGGAVSGFLATLFWGLVVLIPKLIAGERLGASDPATPRDALLNVLFNAVFFGLLPGTAFGAVGGAVAGLLVRAGRAHAPQVGVWLGAVIVAGVGLVISPPDFRYRLIVLIGSGLIGALGGLVGDRLFAWLYAKTEINAR